MKNNKISDEELLELIEQNNNEKLEELSDEDKLIEERISELKEVLQAIGQSQESDVPAHIAMNVQQAIFDEQNKSKGISWLQIAASVSILIVGFAIGKLSDHNSTSELAALRSEINELKEVTLTSALQQYTASERIMAVNQIQSTKEAINPELVSTLINTLNSDESPNVRYAALQALEKYVDYTDVRSELVKSLESQQDPLIQISLITILVEAEERSAIAPLKDIINNEDVSPEVKQQADVAIQVLT